MGKVTKIQAEWTGKTAVVMASGPGMTAEVSEIVRRHHISGHVKAIVVNDTFRLAAWADVLYAADMMWWKAPHNSDVAGFKGKKFSIIAGAEPSINGFPDDVHLLVNGGSSGIDTSRDHIRTCMNSGYQAMHIAVHYGVKKIVLCGFNMRVVKEKRHWFGDHPPGLNKDSPYSAFINLMTTSAPAFSKAGIDVVNCTPNTALHCFRVGDLEKELEASSMCVDKGDAAVPSNSIRTGVAEGGIRC